MQSIVYSTVQAVEYSAVQAVEYSAVLLQYTGSKSSITVSNLDCNLPSLNVQIMISTELHWAELNHNTLHWSALQHTSLHCTTLHCTKLYCYSLNCTSLQYSVIHCTDQNWSSLPVGGTSFFCYFCLELASVEDAKKMVTIRYLPSLQIQFICTVGIATC